MMSHPKQNLKSLQAEFQACLMNNDRKIESSIQSTPHFGVQDRLSVYADGYRLRLVDVLAKDFPTLKLFCGEDKFDDAAFAYLDQHPSGHYSLYQFGKHFSDFLKFYFKDEKMIAELAAFERALGEVLLAGNAKRIGVQALLDLTPEQWPSMVLSLHPAVQSLDLTLNVAATWRALRAKQPLPAVVESPANTYLIWRFHLQPFFRVLTPEEARILKSMQRGFCFSEICENLMGAMEEEKIGVFVAGALRQWLMDGIFIDVRANTKF